MSRDAQMQKVYDWEAATPWYKKVSNLTEKDCERVVQTLNNHTVAYRKKNRRRDVTVQFLNGSGYSYADGREISLRRRIKFESIRLWQERLHLNGRKRLSVSFP
jgi:hypothetical protein